MNKVLYPSDINDAILDNLEAQDPYYFRSGSKAVTSPTAVCERLEKLGFETMTGGFGRRRPIQSMRHRVWEVACSGDMFACEISGNTRRIKRRSIVRSTLKTSR